MDLEMELEELKHKVETKEFHLCCNCDHHYNNDLVLSSFGYEPEHHVCTKASGFKVNFITGDISSSVIMCSEKNKTGVCNSYKERI